MRKWFVSSVAFAMLAGVSAAQEIQIDIAPVEMEPVLRVALPGPGYAIGGNRMGPVDAIFTGRVVALEPMDVMTKDGDAQAKYRIAVVQISEIIHGVKKDTKQVRVGYVAVQNPRVGPGGGPDVLPVDPPVDQPVARPFPGRRPFINGQVQLQMGQEGLFRVNKHAKESFFVAPTVQNFVTKENNANFETEVKNAKSVAKVMGDPMAALKGQDKDARYVAAAMLISKYRMPENPMGRGLKEEKIDAEESKLILTALVGGNWKSAFNGAVPNPMELFNQLNINQNDGYNPMNIRTQEDVIAAMQKWLNDNSGKYRINKLVIDPNAKGGIRPGVRPGIIQPGIIDLPIRQPDLRDIQIDPVPAPAPAPAPNGRF